VLVANHGPFTWGKNAKDAAHNAVILEEIAQTAFLTQQINGESSAIGRDLHDRHYLRKHGTKAYYGQSK
jgi:L-ribulose-5-phosphate 4-epimerase